MLHFGVRENQRKLNLIKKKVVFNCTCGDLLARNPLQQVLFVIININVYAFSLGKVSLRFKLHCVNERLQNSK